MRVSGAQRCLFLFHMHTICGPWCLRLPDRPKYLSVSVQSGQGPSLCLSLLVQHPPKHRGISVVDGALEGLITFRKVADVVQSSHPVPPVAYSYIIIIVTSHSVGSDSLRPHESQHARPPCPSATPGVHSDSHPSSDAIQPSHPGSSPSPPAPNPSQHQSLSQ